MYWGDAEERDPWDDVSWLGWLKAYPQAWQSFAIIENVAREEADEHDYQLLKTLVNHGVRLLQKVISANKAEELKLEWGWLDNRPALRVLMQLIDMTHHTEEELPLLEWIVLVLNPDDNGGYRER